MSFRKSPILLFAACIFVSAAGFTALAKSVPLSAGRNPVGLHHAGSNAIADADNGLLSLAPSPSAPAVPLITRFAPNYATDLLNLRRWQKDELVIFVTAPDTALNPDNYDYASAIQHGASLWDPYLGGALKVRFTDDPQEADIHVTFVDHGTLPDGAIGRTEVTYRNRDNVIVGATMRIDRTLKSNLLSQVAAHEFGHAFGLEGHSVERGNLMYARAHLPAAITQRDANTLHLNYSLQAARSDAKPSTQVAEGSVVSTDEGTRTVAACSLPADDK